jgi:hypothetical protein
MDLDLDQGVQDLVADDSRSPLLLDLLDLLDLLW